MNGPADLTRGWLAKADSDLASARVLAVQVGPFDTACFHAQQAIEKYLKGFLAFRGERFPFTHDLEELVAICRRIEPDFPVSEGEVVELSDYAVSLRYDPEYWPSQPTAVEAVARAEQVRAAIASLLPPDLLI
jgi:HEPN domain-containing protein